MLSAVATTVVGTATTAQARPIEEVFSVAVASEAFGDMSFTRANSSVVVLQSNQVEQELVSIDVRQNDTSVLRFDFSSRDGSKQMLGIDYYGHAQRYPFTDPGRPGISMWPFGFCGEQSGNFEVRDIQRDGPAITRLWITFQRFCDDASPVFGELRLGYPEPSHDVAPQVVRWPRGTYPNRSGHDVPITVRATSTTPTEVTSVALAGEHASDFVIRDNECGGPLTTSGCVVLVGFTPHEPGPRHAELLVATTSGDTTVSLDGPAALGTSDWTLDLDHDDPTTPDDHFDLGYSASLGVPYEFVSQAFADDGTIWNARFDLAGNETFQPGHYQRNPDGTGLVMSLSRGNTACEIDAAAVDIADIAYTGPDSDLAMFDLTMAVHCRSAAGYTVHGRLRFHDGADLTAPAPVTDLRATRLADSVRLEWTDPAEADLADVIVRWYPGPTAPSAPDGGHAATVDAAGTTDIPVAASVAVSASVWTYDSSGNLGSRTEITVTS